MIQTLKETKTNTDKKTGFKRTCLADGLKDIAPLPSLLLLTLAFDGTAWCQTNKFGRKMKAQWVTIT